MLSLDTDRLAYRRLAFDDGICPGYSRIQILVLDVIQLKHDSLT